MISYKQYLQILNDAGIHVIASPKRFTKFSLAQIFTAHISANSERDILYYGCEQIDENFYEIVAAMLEKANYMSAIKEKKIDELSKKLKPTIDKCKQRIRVLVPSHLPTVSHLKQILSQTPTNKKSCIIIDCLQSLVPENNLLHPSYEQNIESIMRDLHELKQTSIIPIILLSKLDKRKCWSNLSTEAQITDLDGGSSIEEIASTVTFLHQDKNHPEIITLRIEKNHSGPTGKLYLAWNKKEFCFSEQLNI